MINDFYKLENPEIVNKLVKRYPKIETFLNSSIEKFEAIGYPISLSAIVEKPCSCTDEEEDLLWIYIEADNKLTPEEEFDIEFNVFRDIIGSKFVRLSGMIGVSVR